MGAYWGSVWYAVLNTPEEAYVEQIDKRPCGVEGTSDAVMVPIPQELNHLECVKAHATEREAINAVRRYRLVETGPRILELVCAIEVSKQRLDLLRCSASKSDGTCSETTVEETKADIAQMRDELSGLRSLRRSKVIVR